jgi:hypothetical protein
MSDETGRADHLTSTDDGADDDGGKHKPTIATTTTTTFTSIAAVTTTAETASARSHGEGTFCEVLSGSSCAHPLGAVSVTCLGCTTNDTSARHL